LQAYGKSYIAASYVKFIEAAGARVVPIFHSASKADLETVFNNVNGVLFPGGGSDLNGTPLYQAAQYLYTLAIQANDKGVYFPVQGHCMGFEMLHMIVSQNTTVLSKFDAENITLALDFTPLAKNSRMFADAPGDIYNILGTQPVTMNNHMYGVGDPQYKQNPLLSQFFDILSYNSDREGKTFISSAEGKNYPVYALQWHPEKPMFEWNPNEVTQHTPSAVRSMQYIADFFVSESLKNDHSFATSEDEYTSLIWNFSPLYTAHIIPDF
jgi:gamma-glutamyl hydrolase